jgi:GNAT superfamily N-acetyltransferase
MDACVAVLSQVHAQDGYPLKWPADPSAWLSSDRQVAAWVADDAGIISGHVALAVPHSGEADSAWAAALSVPVADVLCVSTLFVSPQDRGRGIGGRLLEVALGAARARGASAALEVVSLNRHAVALYRARGWREIGSVRYDWMPDDAQSLLFVPPDPTPS